MHIASFTVPHTLATRYDSSIPQTYNRQYPHCWTDLSINTWGIRELMCIWALPNLFEEVMAYIISQSATSVYQVCAQKS